MLGKRTSVYLALAFGLAMGSAAAAEESEYKAAILKIERGLAAARSAADVAKYLAPDIVFDDLYPGRLHGAKRVVASLTAQYAALKDLKVDIPEITIEADRHLAFAYSFQHCTFISVPSNEPMELTFRQTDAYRRIGNEWRLIYQHNSFPLDAKTGKAIFNAAAPKE